MVGIVDIFENHLKAEMVKASNKFVEKYFENLEGEITISKQDLSKLVKSCFNNGYKEGVNDCLDTLEIFRGD